MIFWVIIKKFKVMKEKIIKNKKKKKIITLKKYRYGMCT